MPLEPQHNDVSVLILISIGSRRAIAHENELV